MVLISSCASKGNQVQLDNSPTYKIIAIAETELANDGSTCSDAIGTIRLYENGVYGSARDTFGRGFKITGKVNNGKVTGGFAISVITAVDFEGTIEADYKHANGTWEDVYKCKGTWKATKVI